MDNVKETIKEDNQEEQLVKLSEEEQKKIANAELESVPATIKLEVQKHATPADLVIFAQMKEKITTFKRKYPASKFKIDETFVYDPNNPDQKKTYEKALDAWRDPKNFRTKIATPAFKTMKAPLQTVLNYYISLEGEVIDGLKAIEEAPYNYKKKYEAAKVEYEEKEAKAIEERTNKRVKDLVDAGAVFDSEYYSIGSEEFGVKTISLGMADINAMTDVAFSQVFEQVVAGATIIAQKEKEKKDAAAEKAQQEKDEMEKEKKQLQAGRIELRGELAEAAGMAFNADRDGYEYGQLFISMDNIKEYDKAQWDMFFSTIKTQIKNIKDAAKEKEEKEQRLIMRPKDLKAIGMEYNASRKGYNFHEVEVSNHYLETAANDAWEECIEDAKGKIEVIKTRIAEEEKRQNEVLALGYTYVNNFYYYKSIKFDLSSYMKLDADKWQAAIEYLKKQPAEIDNAIKLQQERYALLANYATFGEQVDMTKLAELTSDRFNELLNSKKAAYDTKIANDLEEEKTRQANEKAENLAKSSDAVKLQHVIDHLPAIPEMASEEYKKIADTIKQKFDEIRGLRK